MSLHIQNQPQFMLTPPMPCTYIKGQVEQKYFTPLSGQAAAVNSDILSAAGYRRSQMIAYKPACKACKACKSLRIVVNDFKPTRTMKRVIERNQDIFGAMSPARPSSEQYSLFRDYVHSRHYSGGMTDMSMLDYTLMIEETNVRTSILEYRLKGPDSAILKRGQGALKAFALTDILSDGLSMVYSVFEPEEEERSLGTAMIIDHIYRAKEMKLPYVYLGFMIKESPKMAYKAKFKPHELFVNEAWERHD